MLSVKNGASELKMSDFETETEFLKQCLKYDKSAECQNLEQAMAQIQRDERCVGRAASLMFKLTAFSVAGLAYPACLMPDFPYGPGQFLVNVVCALVGGSLISLLVFAGLGMIYRGKLNGRREECRKIVSKLLEAAWGKSMFLVVPDPLNPCKPPEFVKKNNAIEIEFSEAKMAID
jgi:hypothetical protein